MARFGPATGRWLGRDPIEEGDGPNRYSFVRNTPLNVVELDGRSGWSFSGYGWQVNNQNGQWNYTQLPSGESSGPLPAPPLGESLIPIYGSILEAE
ncbi:MAG: RHS repeat-associated core domain-containing protein [Acidobacteriota bacterium]